MAAAAGMVAALALAACGALPPQNGTVTQPSQTDLPSPSTVIPSESDAPSSPPASSSSSPSTSPSDSPSTPSDPSTPTPPPPAGPNCKKLKCIALTYDDGPVPDTSRLARILKEENVKATFFMLGELASENPEQVRDVQASGSELANHSWNHPSLPGLGTEGMRSQLTRTNNAIEKAAGVKVTLMRPPYGNNNRRLDIVARDLGLAEIFWNVDTEDWKYKNDTDRLVNTVLGNASRDQVVLMHDIHDWTVDGARTIIRGLKKRGFTMVTISELYPKARPGGHYPLYFGRGFAKKSDYPKR